MLKTVFYGICRKCLSAGHAMGTMA
jgi:hypothetical protein